MNVNFEGLDLDAQKYYLNPDQNDKFVKDQFIEHASNDYSMKWLSSHLNRESNVLAMGYGDGDIAQFLTDNCRKVCFIEGSKILIEHAAQKFPQATFIHTLFEDFIPTERYDIIIATHIFEHVDDSVDLLKKMKNWINNDSKIIIVVPNKESIHRKLAVLMGLQPELDTLSERDYNVGHQRVYSFETLEKDVKSAGYKIDQKYAFTLKILPNSMMLDFPISLIKAFNEISQEIPIHLLANIAVVIKK